MVTVLEIKSQLSAVKEELANVRNTALALAEKVNALQQGGIGVATQADLDEIGALATDVQEAVAGANTKLEEIVADEEA